MKETRFLQKNINKLYEFLPKASKITFCALNRYRRLYLVHNKLEEEIQIALRQFDGLCKYHSKDVLIRFWEHVQK